MTLQQLRCFTAVAKNLNFRRAAEQLYISQPAVSHQIRTLEAELGVPLFQRVQRHILLTEAGRNFYSDAVDILDRVEFAQQRARRAAVSGPTLHIGCESSIQLYRLPQIYELYRRMCPEVFVSNTEVTHTERRALLMSGQLDAAFMSRISVSATVGLSYATLFEGRFCCVLPAGHRLADQPEVSARDLEGEVLILLDAVHCPPEMDAIQAQLLRECRKVELNFSGSSLYTVPMIEGGLGVAVMPDFVCPASDKIRLVPFQTENRVEYGIAWHTNDSSEKVRRFVHAARTSYDKL